MSLVSKVNTGGILAEERAAESWDCFPKFLAASPAACQSWYLCLIVITPPRADHYLAACLQLPSHSQKEIIKAGMLLREMCRCCSCCLIPKSMQAPCPSTEGSFAFHPKSYSIPPVRHLGSSCCSKGQSQPTFLKIFPMGVVQPGLEKGSE